MKKNFILSIFAILLVTIISPIVVSAETIDLTKYTSKDLAEVFEEEEIEYDFSSYKDNDDKITIYLFRGKGCAYCGKFLNYLKESLLDKYGDKFKIVSYEV